MPDLRPAPGAIPLATLLLRSAAVRLPPAGFGRSVGLGVLLHGLVALVAFR